MRLLRISGTALAACSMAVLPPAAAYAGGVTQVAGVMAFDGAGTCTEDPSGMGAYLVAGDLSGCWYTTTFVLEHHQNNSYRYSGTELFDGYVGGHHGTFTTTFTFTAQITDDGTELHGRCHHPITGGTEVFAGATGVINMHDNPDGTVDYAGHVRLADDGSRQAVAARTSSAGTSSTTC